jgi:hypothetical protein
LKYKNKKEPKKKKKRKFSLNSGNSKEKKLLSKLELSKKLKDKNMKDNWKLKKLRESKR